MQPSELRLTLAEYDPGPTAQFNDYFHWEAALHSAGFAGAAMFVASRPEIAGLVDQLATLDATLLVQAEWRSGPGEEDRFGILVRPNGHTGRLVVQVSLAAPVSETRYVRRVTGVFGIMPNTLRGFTQALRCIVADPAEGTVVTLASDRDADV